MTYPRYSLAEWVPWQRTDPMGNITYWAGENQPAAVVLHIMAGYATTARAWAEAGHNGASWHFTIDREGQVMQHLDLSDAGWHAGISPEQGTSDPPVWPLWRGNDENVNRYTIGVEHEGFPGTQFTPEQQAASKALCEWLAQTLDIPYEINHFPPHAAIDVVNRVDDFNTPPLRDAHYGYLFYVAPGSQSPTEEEPVTQPTPTTPLATAAVNLGAELDAFNTALQQRFAITALAVGDYENVVKAYGVLKSAGLVA